jgi:prepilin-type processing-associated H-X9-DG protein
MRSRSRSISIFDMIAAVAIMGFVVFTLFPVLVQAGEDKSDETCMSNLKKIHQAVMAYSEDWDGYGPATMEHIYKSAWMGQIAKNLGFTGKELSNCWGAGGSGLKAVNADMYIKELQCPSRWNKAAWSGGNTYGMNANICLAEKNPYAAGPPLKLSDMKYPKTTLLASDSNSYVINYLQVLAATCDPAHKFYSGTHNGGLNVLFCDGHAEFKNHGTDGKAWEYASSSIILRPGWRGAPK